MAEKSTVIVVRRIRKIQGGGHHGGSWKVAYADFVTAMMAFFMVMWLVGATTTKERAAISEYFRNPSLIKGANISPTPGPNGPGGASTSMIKLGGSMDIPREHNTTSSQNTHNNQTARAQDQRRLEALKQALEQAIARSQALEPFKDQLLLDLTPDGLRIQIIDHQNRPMFDLGSATLKPYTAGILRELAGFIDRVPNHISITGHTDTTAYARTGYTNWELSADRANAARRTLVEAGLRPTQVSRVVGLSSSILFDKQNPQNPINRRISIVIMTQAAEAQALDDSGLSLSNVIPDADTHPPEPRPEPSPTDTAQTTSP